MDDEWQFQLRVTLPDALAPLAAADPRAPVLQPLLAVLGRHDATLVSQFGAFAAYVAEAEREGTANYPLYRWTKATVDDPAMRAKHSRTFAVHVGGQEVYPAHIADALEADLRPLAGGDLVARMTRHDTNPASNMAVPERYRG